MVSLEIFRASVYVAVGFLTQGTVWCALNCGRFPGPPMREEYIIGGTEAAPGSWPWMVAIMKRNRNGNHSPWCSGYMIDRRHALSAAHCFKRNETYTTRIGDINLARGEVYPIRSIAIPDGYRRGLFYDDIALITLAKDVDIPNFNPVCLPPEGTFRNLTGKGTTVVGWGTARSGGTMSPTLRQLSDIPVLNNSVCSRAYVGKFTNLLPRGITSGMLCAGFIDDPGKDSCKGDSGGPLMYRVQNRWYAVGVVSFGYVCGIPEYPGVYTKLSEYMSWIKLNKDTTQISTNVTSSTSDRPKPDSPTNDGPTANDRPTTNDRPTNDRPPTSDRPTSNKPANDRPITSSRPITNGRSGEGVQFGKTSYSRQEFSTNLDFIYSIRDNSSFELEFKTSGYNGVMFYVGEGLVYVDFLGLYMRDGKIVYVYDSNSGSTIISSQNTYNDGLWHRVSFSRRGRNGRLVIDNTEDVPGVTLGPTTRLHVKSPFYVGGLSEEVARRDQDNLNGMVASFPGCIRNVIAQGELWTLEMQSLVMEATCCSSGGCPGLDCRCGEFSTGCKYENGKKECLCRAGYEHKRGKCRDETEAPDAYLKEGIRFGISPYSRQEFAQSFDFVQSIGDSSVFELEFRTSGDKGVMFYVGEGLIEPDYLGLYMRDGKIIYVFDYNTGPARISSQNTYNDGVWHHVKFSRQVKVGRLLIDGTEDIVGSSWGNSISLEVKSPFYVGGISEVVAKKHKNNLNGVVSSFPGCIRNVKAQGEPWTPDKQSLIMDATCCSDNEEDSLEEQECPGFSTGVQPYEAVRFGNTPYSRQEFTKDAEYLESIFDNSMYAMEFKTTEQNGLMFYVEETVTRDDFLGLYMEDGRITFVFDCGTGSAVITSQKKYDDGRWHRVVFSRQLQAGRLIVDDKDDVQGTSPGKGYRVRVRSPFYVGGVSEQMARKIKDKLNDNYFSFRGCLRKVESQGELWTTDKQSLMRDVKCCFNDVEPIVLTSADGEYKGLCSSSSRNEAEITEDLENQFIGHCILPLHPQHDTNIVPEDGVRFGNTPYSRQEFAQDLDFMDSIEDDSNFELEFKTSGANGVLFYVGDGVTNPDFLALIMENGKLIYLFDGYSGSAFIASRNTYNDGEWHQVVFLRTEKKGRMVIDGNAEDITGESPGDATMVNAKSPFFVGGLSESVANKQRHNLRKVTSSFPGCIRNVQAQDELWTTAEQTLLKDATSCSSRVEEGTFFSAEGGHIVLYKKYRVGQQKSISLDIKPRSLSGVLMAVHGRRDYLILQLIDGRIEFTVDNGNGPITATYISDEKHQLCDGEFHTVVAVSRSNHSVTLTVDGQTSEKSLVASGISSTDTYNPLYVGGLPESSLSKKGVLTKEQFVGCVRNIVLDHIQQHVEQAKVSGGVTLTSCPVT